jgi:threonine dehydrogenase-like Zn-dependent dehydrogenase
VVLGLGPIGEMSTRIAQHRGAGKVIAVDLVPERLARASAHGVQALNLDDHDDLPETVRELTDGRGPIAVIDAVGMEAHGAPVGRLAHKLAGLLPDAVAQQVMQTAGIDRLSALHMAIELVQRGGTISLSGVYGGAASPMPLLQMFDKQINLRMGQANVKHWIDDILPLLSSDNDPLGVDSFATHHLPLDEAPHAYEIFQKKEDNAFKILLKP